MGNSDVLSGSESSSVAEGTEYRLVCEGCRTRFGDDCGTLLQCPRCGDDSALLKTEYAAGDFPLASTGSGIFRYREWLPVRRHVPGSTRPLVIQSSGLSRELGLSDLWIAFSGYWPERGCAMKSTTFKELEAYAVLARTPCDAGIMVAASAGNTAAAFIVASRDDPELPIVLVVPDRALPNLEMLGPAVGPNIRILALTQGTYNDAISFGKAMVNAEPKLLFSEGGVRNVARRDGLAVVALTAYEEMGRGRLPDYYFQAVGSGAGAIAAFEAFTRIAASDPRSELHVPRIFMCQNSEFAPIHRAWTAGEVPVAPSLVTASEDVYAAELVNGAPPFLVRGGVKDVLSASRGDVLVADYSAAVSAAMMFEDLEGIDIAPAAAVAVACLRDGVRARTIPRDARILLNVTGGGRKRLHDTVARGSLLESPAVLIVGRDVTPAAAATSVLRSLNKIHAGDAVARRH